LILEKIETDQPLNFFPKKKFSAKWNAHLRLLRANQRQVPLPDKGMGWRGPPLPALSEGVSTFTSGLPQISATRP
jgi:hypothetical protein